MASGHTGGLRKGDSYLTTHAEKPSPNNSTLETIQEEKLESEERETSPDGSESSDSFDFVSFKNSISEITTNIEETADHIKALNESFCSYGDESEVESLIEQVDQSYRNR